MSEQAVKVFRSIAEGQQRGVLIRRSSGTDKEFHFQNWVEDRIASAGVDFTATSRNAFPDFVLAGDTEGIEVKGLATPGRETTFDSNSQVPVGSHDGLTIYYAFGRYPKGSAPAADFKVRDLVLCHGDFLGVDYGYVHQNKAVRGFGAYGDVLIRDRKMYVPKTPFALLNGAAGTVTLVLPEDDRDGVDGLVAVGSLVRTEVADRVVAYRFDLRSNQLSVETEPNPTAGAEHRFTAWRLPTVDGDAGSTVSLSSGATADAPRAVDT